MKCFLKVFNKNSPTGVERCRDVSPYGETVFCILLRLIVPVCNIWATINISKYL